MKIRLCRFVSDIKRLQTVDNSALRNKYIYNNILFIILYMADICDRDLAAVLVIWALSRTDLSALQFLTPFIHKILENKNTFKIPELRQKRIKKEQNMKRR